MGEIGELEGCRNGLRRTGQRLGGIAVFACWKARLLRQRLVFRQQSAVHGFRPPLRPTGLSASRPFFAAQKFSAMTATPEGTWTTLTTPGTALAAAAVDRLEA